MLFRSGAIADKQGFFQAADGGTLFLDEVADLSLNLQVKLLRAIQESQGFAASGRRDQQGVRPGPSGRDHLQLMPSRRPAAPREPVGEEGGKLRHSPTRAPSQ